MLCECTSGIFLDGKNLRMESAVCKNREMDFHASSLLRRTFSLNLSSTCL